MVSGSFSLISTVVEAYRLDRYDNPTFIKRSMIVTVVEAYRLDRYDNLSSGSTAASRFWL